MTRLHDQPVVLLLDADALVGMDLGDTMEAAGYRVLGPLATTREALSLLERETPTLAIVDVILRDGPCSAVVQELRRRSVPFLVHTGCEPDRPLTDEFRGAPWLSKPALSKDLVALCDELSLKRSRLASDRQNLQPILPLRPVGLVNGSLNPFVRKLAGFATLSDPDRAMLERISANPSSVAAGTDIAHEGDKPDGMVLVLDGMACRHKHRASGSRQIMAYLVPGDAGDLDVALLDEMDHSITTFSACQVVRIPPETIADLLQNHPQVARALRMSTLVDEATLREWLVNVGCRSAPERVAHLFCELLVRMQVVGRATHDSYALPITQADLSDTTGIPTVHVDRTLQELREQGVIELSGGRLTILNLPRLKTIAEFKSNYLHIKHWAAA